MEKDYLCLRCKCGSCYLHVERDEDGEWFFELTNYPEPFSGWERIKQAWKVLKGEPLCLGDVILDDEDAERLKEYIQRKLHKTRRNPAVIEETPEVSWWSPGRRKPR